MLPNVVRRIDWKLEIPPFGIELRRVARQTSQIRMSLNVSMTWAFFKWAFCVPLQCINLVQRKPSYNPLKSPIDIKMGYSGRLNALYPPLIILDPQQCSHFLGISKAPRLDR